MKSLLRILLLTLLLPAASQAETLSFAAFGDTPYRHWERENLPDMMAEMDKANLAFVVNIGDIKSGSSACTDQVYDDILGLFQNSAHPLISTPGDNEWTDCERGGKSDPQERLAHLRQLFHSDEYSLGKKKLKLERQSNDARYAMYRENARWQMGGIQFLTINVPGSRNDIIDTRHPSAEYLSRNEAVLDWLSAGFQHAKEQKLPGIVIFMHADASLEKSVQGSAGTGYSPLVKRLVEETRNFPGQVLLVHGDTHYHRVDKPLGDRATGNTLQNFTRMEVYGSPFMGWVEVNVDTTRTEVFRFKSHPFTITPVGE